MLRTCKIRFLIVAAALCCIGLFTTCKNTVGLGGTVDITPPEIKSVYPPNNYEISHSLITNQRFSWKHSLPLKTFFVVAKDSDFKDIVFEKETSISSFVGLNLKPDVYYWQVRIYNADKSIFAMSEVKSFSVVPPLDIPPLIFPYNNERVSVLEDEDIKLKWQRVHNADYYEVSVFNSRNKRIAFFPILKATEVSSF